MLLTTFSCQSLTTASTVPTHGAKPAKRILTTNQKIQLSFKNGTAESLAPQKLLAAGVFKSAPLIGGTYKRTEPVKYIVLHSTETASPADGPRVVRSWNNRGKSHPGAQYVVDRDGSIYQTVSPEIACMHVNAFITKYGVGNRNSIGIEIVRAGNQKYTEKQLKSLTCLCLYLQKRFDVADDKIVAHAYVQPSDRRDPVDFNWQAFKYSKSMLNYLALKSKDKQSPAVAIADEDAHHQSVANKQSKGG